MTRNAGNAPTGPQRWWVSGVCGTAQTQLRGAMAQKGHCFQSEFRWLRFSESFQNPLFITSSSALDVPSLRVPGAPGGHVCAPPGTRDASRLGQGAGAREWLSHLRPVGFAGSHLESLGLIGKAGSEYSWVFSTQLCGARRHGPGSRGAYNTHFPATGYANLVT